MWKRRAKTILLSYRRADTGAVAGHLAEKLKGRFGAGRVFIDVDNIPFGVDFRQHIRSTMERCDVVIALIGPRWTGEAGGARRIDDPADYLRIEVETALALGLRVIPVLVDQATMPSAASLPASLAPLAYLNAAPLGIGRDFNVHAQRITEAIERLESAATRRPAPWRAVRDRVLMHLPDLGLGLSEWCLSLGLLYLALEAVRSLPGQLPWMPGFISGIPGFLFLVTGPVGCLSIAMNAGFRARFRWRLSAPVAVLINGLPVPVILYNLPGSDLSTGVLSITGLYLLLRAVALSMLITPSAVTLSSDIRMKTT